VIGPFDSEPTGRARAQRDAALPCPDCCGEGHIEVTGGPGYFDEREEVWMPSEEFEPCTTCRATGVLESEEPDAPDPITNSCHAGHEPAVEVEDAEPALPF
jgi:hypothetical protein